LVKFRYTEHTGEYLFINHSVTPEHEKAGDIKKLNHLLRLFWQVTSAIHFRQETSAVFTHNRQPKICGYMTLVSAICKLKRASLEIVHSKEHGRVPQALARGVNLSTSQRNKSCHYAMKHCLQSSSHT
jgi:hypothetical protein